MRPATANKSIPAAACVKRARSTIRITSWRSRKGIAASLSSVLSVAGVTPAGPLGYRFQFYDELPQPPSPPFRLGGVYPDNTHHPLGKTYRPCPRTPVRGRPPTQADGGLDRGHGDDEMLTLDHHTEAIAVAAEQRAALLGC